CGSGRRASSCSAGAKNGREQRMRAPALSSARRPARPALGDAGRLPVEPVPTMQMIADTAGLAAFCARLAQADYIKVDTEFMRERTYWPQLCLVQVAGPEEAACVDPLAEGMDLKPLLAGRFAQPQLKVFHAARQDPEIFFHMTGDVPKPLFDTQVAGMVCGYGEAASYETLAGQLAGAKIDKSARFTDWAARPLSQ